MAQALVAMGKALPGAGLSDIRQTIKRVAGEGRSNSRGYKFINCFLYKGRLLTARLIQPHCFLVAGNQGLEASNEVSEASQERWGLYTYPACPWWPRSLTRARPRCPIVAPLAVSLGPASEPHAPRAPVQVRRLPLCHNTIQRLNYFLSILH